MKAIRNISLLVLLMASACTSSLYTGIEYDDLYYLPSDKPLARAKTPVDRQVVEGNLQSQDYYDNIYAADTLVSDEYSEAVSDDIINQENNYYGYDNSYGNDYFGNYSYTG
jgi:hypothetical protein